MCQNERGGGRVAKGSRLGRAILLPSVRFTADGHVSDCAMSPRGSLRAEMAVSVLLVRSGACLSSQLVVGRQMQLGMERLDV